MNVSVSPNNVEKEINGIYDCLQDFLLGVSKINRNVQDISGVWRGADYQQFQDKMGVFTDNLLELQRILVDYHDFLTNYMKAGERLDSVYQNQKINLE